MSPTGFPLVQCEGETEHWLVPPDWCWGRHLFPHQLALEVHPGWLCLTPINLPCCHSAGLTNPVNPYEQCFLNCRSEQNPVLFLTRLYSLFCPPLIGLNLIYSVWVLGWFKRHKRLRTSALSSESQLTSHHDHPHCHKLLFPFALDHNFISHAHVAVFNPQVRTNVWTNNYIKHINEG